MNGRFRKMMLLLVLALIMHFALTARMPTHPYMFPSLEPSGLLPFSKEETAIIAKQGITHSETWSQGHVRRFYFNELGQCIREELFMERGKKKPLHLLSTHYRYNRQGQLIVRSSKGIEPGSYDSLAYDQDGRLVYWHCTQFDVFVKKRTWESRICFELRMMSATGDQTVLADATDSAKTFYTFNLANECVGVTSDTEAHRIEIENNSDGEMTKVYRWKAAGDSLWHTGMKEIFRNKLLVKRIRYEKYQEGAIHSERHFAYDLHGRLVCDTGDDRYRRNIFYSYASTGLLFDTITSDHDQEPVVSRQRYYYNKPAGWL